jgi:bacteriorhodopsin
MEMTGNQYDLVKNAISFTLAGMAAATLFFWLGRNLVSRGYQLAVIITGLVTFIATYHYYRIYESFNDSTSLDSATGMHVLDLGIFNDAYRYVDWLLTVPLLLIELILVMRLSQSETVKKASRLGLLAAVMVILGYPGEISSDNGTRWIWWALAMLPFVVIVYELVVGLGKSLAAQPESVRGLLSSARWLVIVSWCFYPVVFALPMILEKSVNTWVAVQVGYSIADIVAKAAFGVFIFLVAYRKSNAEAAA